MRTHLLFDDRIDLGWYATILRFTDRPDRFGFELPSVTACITYDVFRQVCESPKMLSLQQQRALALGVVGTDFETEGLRALLGKELPVSDVYFDVALCCSKSDKKDGGFDNLANKENLSLEEIIFALHVFDSEEYEYLSVKLLKAATVKLYGNLNFIYNYPEMVWWLLKFNERINVKSQFLCDLQKVITTAPDTDAPIYGNMFSYKFDVASTAIVVWAMRTKLGVFDRCTKKNAKAEEDARVELAQRFKKWTVFEQKLIQNDFGGRLKSRIYSSQNYDWYRKNVGLFLPELCLNLNDKKGFSSKIEKLSDSDKCIIAKEMALTSEEAAPLELKFEEWNPELIKYYEVYGKVSSADKRYDVGDTTMFDITDVDLCIAKIYEADTLMESEGVYAATFVMDKSLKAFKLAVEKGKCSKELPDDARELWNSIRWRTFEKDLTLEEYRGMTSEEGVYEDDDEYYGCPLLAEAVTAGADASGLDSEKYDVCEELIAECGNADKVIKLVSKLELTRMEFFFFAKKGTLFTEASKYFEEKSKLDERTEIVLWIAESYAARKFREWTGLSLVECYEHYEIVKELATELLGVLVGENNSMFKNTMRDVYRGWVLDGSPIREMVRKFPLSSNIEYKDGWVDNWCDIAVKKICDCVSIPRMNPCFGSIDDHDCVLTDIGIISFDGYKSSECTIPVWVLAENGKSMCVHISGGHGSEPYYCEDLDVNVFCDTEIEVKVVQI